MKDVIIKIIIAIFILRFSLEMPVSKKIYFASNAEEAVSCDISEASLLSPQTEAEPVEPSNAEDFTTPCATESVTSPETTAVDYKPEKTVLTEYETIKEKPETHPETQEITTSETTLHTHIFLFSQKKEPTFQSDGYDIYICSCGASEQRNFTEAPEWMREKCTMTDYTMRPYEYENIVMDEHISNISYAHIAGTGIMKEKRYIPESEVKYIESFIFNTILYAQEHPDVYNCFLIPADSWKEADELRTRFNAEHEVIMAFYGIHAKDIRSDYTEYAFVPYESETYARLTEAFEWADGVIEKLGINENITKYEAIDKINTYLCNSIQYNNNINGVYETLKTHEGKCFSYSVLFQLLCQKCGIQCYYQNSKIMNHAFNYVKFSDGTIKYIDVTWNDTATYENGELIEVEFSHLSDEARRKCRHGYFLMDEETFMKNH